MDPNRGRYNDFFTVMVKCLYFWFYVKIHNVRYPKNMCQSTLDNFWSFKGYGKDVVMGHPAFSFLCEYLFFNRDVRFAN